MENEHYTEINRRYRVLRQTLFMHSELKNCYIRKSKLLNICILLASTIFCASTFSSETTFTELGVDYNFIRMVFNIASILAFGFSIILYIVDWGGKAEIHKEAENNWSKLNDLYRRSRNNNGKWEESKIAMLLDKYEETDRYSAKIPNSKFINLKKKYLKQVTISEMLSEYPNCPKLFIKIKLAKKDILKLQSK